MSNIVGNNCTHILSLQNDQGWVTLPYTPTIIYIDIQNFAWNKPVFIFASRGAPPHILNAAQNLLLYDYHIVINCDVALRKSKVVGTLG